GRGFHINLCCGTWRQIGIGSQLDLDPLAISRDHKLCACRCFARTMDLHGLQTRRKIRESEPNWLRYVRTLGSDGKLRCSSSGDRDSCRLELDLQGRRRRNNYDGFVSIPKEPRDGKATDQGQEEKHAEYGQPCAFRRRCQSFLALRRHGFLKGFDKLPATAVALLGILSQGLVHDLLF